MVSKIFALCALACVIQGLNGAVIQPQVLKVQSLESELFRDSMSRFESLEAEYAQIIDKFENVVLNTETEAPEAEFAGFFDNIMESVPSLDGSDMAEAGVDMEVVRKCIQEQRPNFEKFVQDMRVKIADARVQLRQLVVDTFTPYIQKARQAFVTLANEVAQFPMKMWECIQERNFLKALEVIQNTRKVVAEQAYEIGRNIREARAKFPEIRKKAMEMREQLRNDARAGMEKITTAVRQCIANGGPKIPYVPVVPVLPEGQASNLVIPVDQVSNLIAPPDAVYEA